MSVKVGINGFGRIGRLLFRTLKARYPNEIDVVAVNDLFDPATNAHLLKHDSTYGNFEGTVEVKDGNLDAELVRIFAEAEVHKMAETST